MAGTWPAACTGWAAANGSPRRAGGTRYDDGVRTVVDLRNSREARRRDTDPAVAEEAWSGMQIVSAPTEEPDDPRFTALCGPYLNDPAHYVHNVRLFPEKLVAVFRAIADAVPAGGVVVHCAAGRDRSGMVAAMLQDLAGDSDGQIANGYAQAARGHQRALPHARAAARPRTLRRGSRTGAAAGKTWPRRGGLCPGPGHRGFLLRHGLTDTELHAVRSVLGVTVAQ